MNEFVKIITHARRFKSAAKELNLEQLMEVQEKLEKIIEDRTVAKEEFIRKNAEKLEKIELLKEIMAADGIEITDLIPEAPVKKSKRAPRPPKYEIKNEIGECITWTGQGRMPGILKSRIEAGDSLDNYLIK